MSFYRIRPKSGTATQWATTNRTLGEREIGFEYVENGVGKGLVKMKMGDGVTPWNDLPYALERNMTLDDLSQLIVQNNTTIDSKVADVKKLLANGKLLVANVVGGNSDTTFQILANNAQTIKTDRDNKLSTVNRLNDEVNSLNSQITAMTQDRNNWMNTANSKVYKQTGIVPYGSYIDINFKFKEGNMLFFYDATAYYPTVTFVRSFKEGIYFVCANFSNNSESTKKHWYGYDDGYVRKLDDLGVGGTATWRTDGIDFHMTATHEEYQKIYQLYYV